MIEYAVKSSVHLFQNELGESEEQRRQRIVMEFIAKHDGSTARSRLLASKILPGGAKDYDDVLEMLVESGKLGEIRNGNRKDHIYHINGK